jgi:branched-chain amino acid transport system permease protein
VLDTILQILLNSVVSALILGLMAIGFTYIFLVTRVFHLAHGGVYVAGAFSFWWLLAETNHWFIAIAFAIAVVTVLIYTIEKTIYLPLSQKQSNQSISLIASMGLYVVIVNVLALLFSNENKQITDPVSGSFEFGNIIFTKVQMLQSMGAILAITAFLIYLKFTKSNLALQSVSDNETVSKVFGINTEKERVKVFVAGSVLACIAAILKTVEVGIDPQAGIGITLTAAVVAILVSRLDLLLIIAFSIALTLLQNTVEWFLNAQWRDGITFLILLLAILFRTEGIISYNLRRDRI